MIIHKGNENKSLSINRIAEEYETYTGQKLEKYLKSNETIRDFLCRHSFDFRVGSDDLVSIPERIFHEKSGLPSKIKDARYILTETENSRIKSRCNSSIIRPSSIEVISLLDDDEEEDKDRFIKDRPLFNKTEIVDINKDTIDDKDKMLIDDSMDTRICNNLVRIQTNANNNIFNKNSDNYFINSCNLSRIDYKDKYEEIEYDLEFDD